jgi:hypothetical protein
MSAEPRYYIITTITNDSSCNMQDTLTWAYTSSDAITQINLEISKRCRVYRVRPATEDEQNKMYCEFGPKKKG